MATITLPAAATQNVVATTVDYPAKKNLNYLDKNNNLLTHTTGSYLKEATILVYDEILRFQRGRIKRGLEMTHGLTPAMIDAFDFGNFEGNVLWFMDELVGLESDWLNNTSPSTSTAYGWVQFTEPSVRTAVSRYGYHLQKFNSRRPMGRRDWVAPGFKNGKGIFDGDSMEYPLWRDGLVQLLEVVTGSVIGSMIKPHYEHEKHLGQLEYDEVLALAFVHLHGEFSKDYNFVQLALGGEAAVTAAKAIYIKNHHASTSGVDNKTQNRIDKFFKLH
jgi:hypothetical protein